MSVESLYFKCIRSLAQKKLDPKIAKNLKNEVLFFKGIDNLQARQLLGQEPIKSEEALNKDRVFRGGDNFKLAAESSIFFFKIEIENIKNQNRAAGINDEITNQQIKNRYKKLLKAALNCADANTYPLIKLQEIATLYNIDFENELKTNLEEILNQIDSFQNFNDIDQDNFDFKKLNPIQIFSKISSYHGIDLNNKIKSILIKILRIAILKNNLNLLKTVLENTLQYNVDKNDLLYEIKDNKKVSNLLFYAVKHGSIDTLKYLHELDNNLIKEVYDSDVSIANVEELARNKDKALGEPIKVFQKDALHQAIAFSYKNHFSLNNFKNIEFIIKNNPMLIDPKRSLALAVNFLNPQAVKLLIEKHPEIINSKKEFNGSVFDSLIKLYRAYTLPNSKLFNDSTHLFVKKDLKNFNETLKVFYDFNDLASDQLREIIKKFYQEVFQIKRSHAALDPELQETEKQQASDLDDLKETVPQVKKKRILINK